MNIRETATQHLAEHGFTVVPGALKSSETADGHVGLPVVAPLPLVPGTRR